MLYTIPYNNSEPESFLECFEPYRANIHSFYFSFPGLFLTHNPTRDSAEERLGKDTNTYRFLEMINGRYKSVLCINTLVYPGKLFKNPCSQAELNKIVPFGFSLQRQKMVFFCH